MGDYLNMVNNDKPVPGTNPNENYARELLQLFSIGLWELNLDGTLLLDAGGHPIPTYDQSTVEGFAHVFTGWTYPLLAGQPPRTHNPKNFLGDMVAVASNHDTGAKQLLDDAIAPAGLAMDADLAGAIRNVFLHPNIAPFVGRQLIQKLVTGDPSPAVRRARGSGIRQQRPRRARRHEGRRARDPDRPRGARRRSSSIPAYGKLREPALHVAAAARAVNAKSDGVFFGPAASLLGQNLFYPPSVFNYYPPDYVVPGTSLVGPEFALHNASTYINRDNVANVLAFGTIAPLATYPGATGTQPDWSALSAVAGNAAALIDKIDALLLHGTMSAAMRSGLASGDRGRPPTR